VDMGDYGVFEIMHMIDFRQNSKVNGLQKVLPIRFLSVTPV
jgi:hypothetical protein